MSSVFVLLNSGGRLFQALGAAQANARSANDVVVLGTSRSPVEADLRRRLDSDSATGLHSSIRYSGALLWIVLYVRRTQFVSHSLWNREPVERVTHMLCDVVVHTSSNRIRSLLQRSRLIGVCR